MKKRRNYRRLIIIILVVLLIGAGIYYVKGRNTNDISEVKVVNKIEGYNYQLTDDKTKLYQTYFKQLNKVLAADTLDEEAYAKLVVQMFVADFYDLNSKVSKNDIGGLVFIHPDAVENFKLNASNTLYKYVENDVYNNRKQLLPVVAKVSINAAEGADIELDDEIYDGYEVSAQWTYKKDLGYETKAKFELVKVDKYYYIIKTD